MTLVLNNQADIESALGLVSWLARPMLNKVELGLPRISEKEQNRIAKSIKNTFNDCGCFWGAPAFLLSFFISFYYLSNPSFWEVAYTFFFSVFVAICAKLLALYVSYKRLKNQLNHLKKLCYGL